MILNADGVTNVSNNSMAGRTKNNNVERSTDELE